MLSQEFAHQDNRDGTHDSICMECLASITTVGSESELSQHESVHVCDPVNLHRMNRDRTPLPDL
jgi:hypothetical protein